jgi:hypothetical protein
MVLVVMQKIKKTLLLVACAAVVLAGALSFSPNASAAKCGGVETAIVSCPQEGKTDSIRDSGVWGVLLVAINILIALVAVAALGGIVYGAILYTSAGGNMEQTKKGMQIIGNVVIGLIAFGLMYTALNFIIPGGVFN